MAKNIIKELIIILLLCLAIILVLGVLLYEYVPMSKTVPNTVSYSTPEEVQQELASSEEVVGTFETGTLNDSLGVDASDLNNYARIQNYKPGKANPFSSYESTTTNGENTTGNNSNSGTTSTNNNSSNSNTQTGSSGETTSGGQFFQDKGTK